MPGTHCPHCGAAGLSATRHAQDDGRSFTQYYCEFCAKAWVERTGGTSIVTPPGGRTALGTEVPSWVERYLPAFQHVNLPFIRNWSRLTPSGRHQPTSAAEVTSPESQRGMSGVRRDGGESNPQ
jgi:hypothetical protein